MKKYYKDKYGRGEIDMVKQLEEERGVWEERVETGK